MLPPQREGGDGSLALLPPETPFLLSRMADWLVADQPPIAESNHAAESVAQNSVWLPQHSIKIMFYLRTYIHK